MVIYNEHDEVMTSAAISESVHRYVAYGLLRLVSVSYCKNKN